MPRPVVLFTGQWADLALEDLAQKAGEWGYQGLELACWGDHCEVQRALSDDQVCPKKLDLLARYDMTVAVVANHRVGAAVCSPVDARFQPLLPDYVWGDGNPDGVSLRAAEEMASTIRVAEKLGVAVVSGFMGSSIWSSVAGWPPITPEMQQSALEDFAARWRPILDVCQECGVRFAAEVHPGELAFDLYSAEVVLDALDGRPEFGFTLDPSHLHWQGVDPVEFIRRFPERIFHVHMKDAAIRLDGRAGLLNSYLPRNDPRRGWQFRCPGRGGVDWEALIRALNEAHYDGPLSVEVSDPGMNRDHAAEEACRFVKRIDFEPATE